VIPVCGRNAAQRVSKNSAPLRGCIKKWMTTFTAYVLFAQTSA
jgi:hypothetical protein